jgi:3-oxoacyl-[acyl-carrier-protein] synthase II
MRKRVVITGMGAVTPIGNSVEEYWQGLLEGRSGVGPITLFDPSDYPTKIAAEVKDFDGKEYFDRKDMRTMARPTQFGVAAALMALEDADWKNRPGAGPLGVVNGISNSAQDAVEAAVEAIINHSYRRVTPTVLVRCFPHSTASETGRLTGFQDHVMTVSTGCTSGLNALGYSINKIVSGECSSVICIAAESTISNYVFGSFCRAGMLSTSDRPPGKVSRPFDADRDGGVLAEGAVAFLVESLEQARARQGHIHAEILACANSGSGYKNTETFEPVIAGMTRAMNTALATATIGSDKIDYIGCHGVSDPTLDALETVAYKDVFGDHVYEIPVSSVKGHTGMPLGVGAYLQAIATIKTFATGIVVPTLNYETPDPQCDLDYVPNTLRRNNIRHALIFAHAFNGSDAALVLKAFD